jgi:hypothetical protein
MSDNATQQEARKHIDTLFQKLREDPDFRDQAYADPKEAMKSIGFPDGLIAEVYRDGGEVGGYDYEMPCSGQFVAAPSCEMTTVCHVSQFVISF